MKIKPRLHHYCQNIAKGHLDDVVEMYKLLGCEVVYTPPNNNTWIMVAQKPLNFAIQITEVSNTPIEDIDKKRQSHIAFISDDPQQVVEKVRVWTEERNFKFRDGGWSNIERYFDLPDIFVNFVIEVMHTSIEEK